MRIDVQNLTKKFGAFTALRNIHLEVSSGELLALLGPSGCGKTTLLRILAGLEFPDSGSIRFDGEEAINQNVRARKVGFVFQHYALFRHMNVFENIAFGLRVRPHQTRPSREEINTKVQTLLKLVKLEDMATRYPSLLLHDEIHITSVFVTHDQEEALEVADRVVVMNAGQIEQIGAPEEVYNHPATPFVYNFLGNVNLFRGRIQTRYRKRDGICETASPRH
ncbi:hypothetical protein DCC62_20410 [candidate division KSB1 bacterium]|nr:MAG: hypothetical protein DCC62_20410 [candidate division KSB1 bacterium]